MLKQKEAQNFQQPLQKLFDAEEKEDEGHLIELSDEFINLPISDAFIFCPTLWFFK